MKVLQRTFVLVALVVAACAPNYLDGNDYRFVGGFPCHPDGSVILAQKANSTGGFTTPTETPAPCTPARPR